jgi:hypothetical protein
MPDGTQREYTTKDYLTANNNYNIAWVELPADTPTPFDDVEQLPLTEKI